MPRRAARLPMLSRYAVPLLCAAAIVFACGPRPHAAESVTTASVAPAPRSPAKSRGRAMKDPLASTVEVSLRTSGEPSVRFALHVSNRSDKRVELLFPSGRTHDFVVRDSAGREVWRWSEGRMFTQALQSKDLQGSESATWTETWAPGARRGRFTVTGTLSARGHAVTQSTEFVLP